MLLNYRDDMEGWKSGGVYSSLLVSIISNHIYFAAFPFGVRWGEMGRQAHLRKMTYCNVAHSEPDVPSGLQKIETEVQHI